MDVLDRFVGKYGKFCISSIGVGIWSQVFDMGNSTSTEN